jgi:hypothetical protein
MEIVPSGAFLIDVVAHQDRKGVGKVPSGLLWWPVKAHQIAVWPQFSSDPIGLPLWVVSDAIQYRMAGHVVIDSVQLRHVHNRFHLAAGGVDSEKERGLPHIRPDSLLGEFQFIQLIPGPCAVSHLQRFDDGKIFGCAKTDDVAAVASDQVLTVMGDAPTLAGVSQRLLLYQRLRVEDKGFFRVPGEHIKAAIQFGYAFRKDVPGQNLAAENFIAERVVLHQERFGIQTRRLRDDISVDHQSLGKGIRVVWIHGQYFVGDFFRTFRQGSVRGATAAQCEANGYA